MNFFRFCVVVGISTLWIASEASSAPKGRSTIGKSRTTEERGRIRFQPHLGLAYTNPKGANSFLSDQADRLGVKSTYKLGTSTSFGIAADYEVYQNIFAGLRLDYLRASTDDVAATAGGKATLNSYMESIPLYATGTYLYPIDSAWSVSGSLGLGWALNYEAGTNISASKIKGLKNGTNAYSANPFTWFLAGTGYYQVTPKIAANLLVGYRHLTSNQLKATAKYETVKEGELLQDSDGANLEVSSNSLLTSLGITFVL